MKEKEITKHAKSIAFIGSLIFVAHPIQTEAVTYICQRTASLAALFYIASLSLYIKARLSQNQRLSSTIHWFYYVSSMVAALLGMFTKELVATLPLMILLYEFCFLQVKKKLNWKYIVPFLAMLLIIPITMISSKSLNLRMMRKLAEGSGDICRGNYLITQFRVLVTYLRLVFIPLNQNVDYDYPISQTLWKAPILASGFLLLFILSVGILLFRRHRLISFCIFWFFLTLSVESSVIPLLNVIFEHRLYLPMVGYSIFFAIILSYFCQKRVKLRIVIPLVIIISYSVLAYSRNEVWKSELALWDDAVTKSPGKARPYHNRSRAYINLGFPEKAISDCNQALRIKPDYANAYNNRGVAYANMGDYDMAVADLDRALSINPNSAGAYKNRGTVYSDMGDYDRAAADLDRALSIDPNSAGAYYNRGIVYENMGKYDKAISDYNQVLSIDPDCVGAYNNRGVGFLKKGNFVKAISDFNQVLSINPDYANAYNNRGIAYVNMGDYDKAIADFDRALSINPDYTSAYKNRRTACEQKGK